VFHNNSSTKIEHIEDGSSNVFLAGETKHCPLKEGHAAGAYGSWDSALRVHSQEYSFPMNLCAAMYGINAIDYSTYDPMRVFTGNVAAAVFGSHHPGGCNFALADGSVHFLTENMDLATYRSLAIRSDGLPLGGFSPQ
jgi:prepilin-type processing-associated H-X9-DG protein